MKEEANMDCSSSELKARTKVWQEKLLLMQRSSYYLEIQREEYLPPTEEQENAPRLSDSIVWTLIDQQRLAQAMEFANTQVKLHLALLEMLYQEILRGCCQLAGFMNKYNQGLLDSDAAASVQQQLQQTLQHVADYESRMCQRLYPLNLQNQLIANTGNVLIPKLSATLAIKLPVVIDRLATCATSNSVHLCWVVTGEESKDPNQQFEIQVRILQPTIADHDQFTKSTCQRCDVQVSNLLPDSYYQFSVRREDAVNMVYEMWTDTIVLKTQEEKKKPQPAAFIRTQSDS
uniref:fibronectin type III domain-containing protein 11-like n=1 Tax=Semicossyphus pulcher TaxID=241346 RepID=UPI0037E9C6F9